MSLQTLVAEMDASAVVLTIIVSERIRVRPCRIP